MRGNSLIYLIVDKSSKQQGESGEKKERRTRNRQGIVKGGLLNIEDC